MDEEVFLIRPDAPDPRVFDPVRHIEVALKPVPVRARTGEAAAWALEGDRRLRDRRRVLAAGRDDLDEAVVERAAVVAACFEMPLDRPNVALEVRCFHRR
jgi:hypothetical protein